MPAKDYDRWFKEHSESKVISARDANDPVDPVPIPIGGMLMHRLMLSMAIVFLAAALTWSPCLAEDADARGAKAPASTEAGSSDAPTSTTEADDSSERIINNFLTLLEGSWVDILKFIGWTILGMILWAIGIAVAGLVLGLILWAILRRKKLFDAPWKWYRYVRWSWALVFMLIIMMGFGYAGVFIGLERGLKSAIYHDLVIDRILMHVYQAIVLSEADYKVTGQETAEQLYNVVADTEGSGNLALEDYEKFKDDFIAKEGDTLGKRLIMRLVADYVLPHVSIHGLDYEAVVKFVFSGMNLEEYLKKYPDAHPLLHLMDTKFEEVRDVASSGVEMLTRGGIYGGLLFGILVPIMLLTAFRVTLRFTVPKKEGAVSPDEAADKPQDEQ